MGRGGGCERCGRALGRGGGAELRAAPVRGGGVERRETVREALAKELREEGNLELTAPPRLVHVYFNRRTSKRDHVVFYRCEVRQTAPRLKDREIVEAGFFALDALPAGTTSATYRRLRELAGEAEFDDLW